jgi:hypothetical protein
MAEDWAKTIAKKVEGRITEEAERAATRRKRYEDGIERFRKQLLDLVTAVNANIESESSRVHKVVLENGIILTAGYKRVVTVEEPGILPDVPASVGKVTLQREDRRAAAPSEPQEIYVTQAGSQTAFYHRLGKDIKQFLEPEFKSVVEFFAS